MAPRFPATNNQLKLLIANVLSKLSLPPGGGGLCLGCFTVARVYDKIYIDHCTGLGV